MNDLRSLEGVAQLLKTKHRSRHHRRTGSLSSSQYSSQLSNPSTPAPTSSSIDDCFPADIAAKLSVLIQRGYSRPVHSQAPLLRKSHSDFVREDIRQLLYDEGCYDELEHSELSECYDEPCTVTLQLPELTALRSFDHAALEDAELDLTLRLSPLIIGDRDHRRHYLMHSDDGDDEFIAPIQLGPIALCAMPSMDFCDAQSSTEEVLHLGGMADHELDMTELKESEYEGENEEEKEEVFHLKEQYMECASALSTKGSFGAVVGNGASGVVTKAFEYASCSLMALKKCRSKQFHEVRAFGREARLYRHFADNEHIIDCFQFARDYDSGELTMALEWMDLGSVDTLEVASARQRELAVGHIANGVLSALDALHSELYVHNDVKPANILCNKYGEVKLGDFGCVTQLGSKHDYLTKNNGTQRYQAPEKLTKQTKYNTATDVWSLGVSLFELLCGARMDGQELTYVSNVPILDAKQHGLSVLCCDFVNRCLCVDEKERPSAAELLTHEWVRRVQATPLQQKWRPWLAQIAIAEDTSTSTTVKAVSRRSGNGKSLRFSSVCDGRQSQNQSRNEDLLFMITALIVYYSRQNVDLSPSVESPGDDEEEMSMAPLHRRISNFRQCQSGYSDAQRIANMARSALCSPESVIERIQVTVASIKSQLNKAEVHRIDS